MTDSHDLTGAHKHCYLNRQSIEASKLCGCFCCIRTFAPTDITEWIDYRQTAVCPYCYIDSVIGDESGLPISTEFLGQMYARWFA